MPGRRGESEGPSGLQRGSGARSPRLTLEALRTARGHAGDHMSAVWPQVPLVEDAGTLF